MRLPTSVVREAMMSVSDAEILDTVRKLRQYVTSMDNSYTVMDRLIKIDDAQIQDTLKNVMPKISSVAKEISVTLKSIENSRPYRDMVRKFNIEDEDDE